MNYQLPHEIDIHVTVQLNVLENWVKKRFKPSLLFELDGALVTLFEFETEFPNITPESLLNKEEQQLIADLSAGRTSFSREENLELIKALLIVAVKEEYLPPGNMYVNCM